MAKTRCISWVPRVVSESPLSDSHRQHLGMNTYRCLGPIGRTQPLQGAWTCAARVVNHLLTPKERPLLNTLSTSGTPSLDQNLSLLLTAPGVSGASRQNTKAGDTTEACDADPSCEHRVWTPEVLHHHPSRVSQTRAQRHAPFQLAVELLKTQVIGFHP